VLVLASLPVLDRSLLHRVAFLSGHFGVVTYLPPKPPTDHSYFVIDSAAPDWLAEVLRVYNWHVLQLPGKSDYDAINSTMRSKSAKIPQHRWAELDRYDFVVWFDDKFQVNVSAAYRTISSWPPHAAVALHRHPKRCTASFPDCSVMEEVDAAVQQQNRYRRQESITRAYVREQQRLGRQLAGHPLYQAGFIVYWQRHRQTDSFQATWMDHIAIAGINDQVSLFFVAQIFAESIIEFTRDWGRQLWDGQRIMVATGTFIALLG